MTDLQRMGLRELKYELDNKGDLSSMAPNRATKAEAFSITGRILTILGVGVKPSTWLNSIWEKCLRPQPAPVAAQMPASGGYTFLNAMGYSQMIESKSVEHAQEDTDEGMCTGGTTDLEEGARRCTCYGRLKLNK